jgi:hypothetical protein
MNTIYTKIQEFYNFLGGGEAQFSSLPQAQKTLLSALHGYIRHADLNRVSPEHKSDTLSARLPIILRFVLAQTVIFKNKSL